MSSIRFGRGREYQFFRREDVRTRWDLRSAVQFFSEFRGDSAVMAQFRRQIAVQGSTQAEVADEQVIERMALMLVSGELLLALPQRQKHRDPLNLREEGPTRDTAPRRSTPAEVMEDEPTFDRKHDGVAQAAVLLAAAKAAYPFCEECAKHAALQASVQ